MFDIAVIGRTVWDDWQLPREALRSGDIDFFGGPGANVALLLAHLGFRCTLVTQLGADSRSKLYEAHLRRAGVDLSFATRTSASMARCLISPGKTYQWVGDNMGFPVVSQRDLSEILASSESVFCTDMTAGVDPSRVLRHSYWSPQIGLSVDPDDCRRAKWLPWGVVFLNKKESVQLARLDGVAEGAHRDSRVTTWITTNEDFPTHVEQSGSTRTYRVPEAEVVISIGGGDAFAAGFCAADLQNMGEGLGMQLGLGLAKQVVSQVGCQLSKEQVREVVTRLGQRTWLPLRN